MMQAKLCLLAGDGIGPEVTAEARAVLDLCAQRFGFGVEWVEARIGGAAIDADGVPLPAVTLERARASDAVLLGAVGGPKWDDPKSLVRPEQALLAIRRALELFGNLRPIRVVPELAGAAPVRAELLAGVDILFVRELTGGVYFGQPSERRETSAGREAVDTVIYSEAEVARVARLAFGLAAERRGRVTSVDKANVLATSRLWREVTHEVAREFPAVQCEDLLVDAMAMHLMRRPRDFDVVVTENMFGDILTDEAAVLTGSLGMLPSASVGDTVNHLGGRLGLYEPVHGSAPDIAGRDLANPLGAILSAAMLLRHSLRQEQAAAAVEDAVRRVLAAGARTTDIASAGAASVGCREMGAAVRRQLERR